MISMTLIAQIALGIIIGGLTLALLVMGFIALVQSQQSRKNKRLGQFAIGLFIAAAVIVVVLIAIASH
jgi:hypothetical protein